MDADPANQMAPLVIRVERGWGLVQDIHGPHQTTQTRLIECHHPHHQVEKTGKNTNYTLFQVFRMHPISKFHQSKRRDQFFSYLSHSPFNCL